MHSDGPIRIEHEKIPELELSIKHHKLRTEPEEKIRIDSNNTYEANRRRIIKRNG